MIAGRYSLVREVGRGGMGAVWLAHDEALGRDVALKRIGMVPGADTTDLARAEREARLAARLSHPHVVAVFNLVVDDDAQWLVMEYVEGTTMSQLVREEGPLTPDQAAPLLWQAADGLVAAHQAGIVHRDVKPSNILVDRRRRVKITDFGIAHVTADPSLTQTGLVTGSPAYLAPEVAAGQRGRRLGRRLVARRDRVPHALRPAAVRHGRPPARRALPHRQRGAAPPARRRLDGPAARGARWPRTPPSGGR